MISCGYEVVMMNLESHAPQPDAVYPQFAGRLGAWCLVALLTLVALTVAPSSSAQSSESDPAAVVQELYKAFGENDLQEILSLVHPEVAWVFHGPEHRIPYAGTFKGRAGVEQFFTLIAETIAVQAIGQRHYSVEDDVVSVLGWERAVHRRTGGEYQADWVHVFTVRDGLIVRFEEITDSGELIEAFAPADSERGKAYFTTCVACHGIDGGGNPAMHAPNLTIQGIDYLVRQLRHFREDVRGGVTDFYGWQMNGRAKALSGDRAVRDVAAYIESLPDVHAPGTLGGNAERGQEVYASQCVSCHGENGEGMPQLGAPALAGLQDWYQLTQIRNFQNELRGSHEQDVRGSQMRPFAVALADEEATRNVLAYIATLKGASIPLQDE
ncbi:c-type cytochrome [Elongatibacter sediminis]|uniref:C-type cytochrome n=1 Tax=Elongatibacter sediminis TaxID=3119006 RepID=A0AAW9RG32_9GAMM